MKPFACVALAASLLAGCAVSKPVKGPNARPAHVIKCAGSAIDACYEKAAELCPDGYALLDSHPSSAGVLLPAGKSTTYSAGPHTMLVECRL